MLQCILKLVERIIFNRVYGLLEKRRVLPGSQFRFRRDKSCADNLAILHAAICDAKMHKITTAAVFLDVEGAYDNVLSDILIVKIQSLGLPNMYVKFIYNLVYSRVLRFNLEGNDLNRYVYRGLPQGSVLSPLLYTLYVSDLENTVGLIENLQVLQFADDICIFAPHVDRAQSLQIVESVCESIFSFLSKLGLSLSPSKSTLCIFEAKPFCKYTKNSIVINRISVSSKPVVKLVGINFQANLRWNVQVKNIINRCDKAFTTIRFLRNTWWGADPYLLLVLYKVLIRSRLDYGSMIWSSLPKYLELQINKLQFRALRAVLGVANFCPTNVLLAEAGECTMRARYSYLWKNYLTRVFSSHDHQLISILDRLVLRAEQSTPFPIYLRSPLLTDNYITNKSEEFQTNSTLTCVMFPPYVFYQTPIISIDEGESIEEAPNPEFQFSNLFTPGLRTAWYFTDGSKLTDEGYAGYAIVDVFNDQIYKYKTSSHTSIFSCEAMAVLGALELGCESDMT